MTSNSSWSRNIAGIELLERHVDTITGEGEARGLHLGAGKRETRGRFH